MGHMRFPVACGRGLALAGLALSAFHSATGAEMRQGQAQLLIVATNLASYQIPRNLTGKFCEHLGANIYNGMDAQILRNPTFADVPFSTGAASPDGIATFQSEPDKIETDLRREATRWGWPETELAEMLTARKDGLACLWSRAGQRDKVLVSPDTGPYGGRAQRIEFKAAAGIKQWTWLPLHRTRRYEYEMLARSPDLTQLQVSILADLSGKPAAAFVADGLKPDWVKLTGSLVVSQDSSPDKPYCLVVSAQSPGQVVIAHLFLRPADHVGGDDPDVIRLLRAAHLPLLRWPGGNFVSAYHWEDGVGPVERRPTQPNYAWGGVEPNTFGTDEFIRFCRNVGCEPMICINAGTGTPEEAAHWIQYCNAPVASPWGAQRAADGHPEPFNVRHWEVGNELWGRWQAHWTTADGYVDRYKRFVQAMRQADPSIRLYACGAPVLWGKSWNDTLVAGAAASIRSLTDHPLIGGDVTRQTDPLDVFRDFMLVPDLLEQKWTALGESMRQAGIAEPHVAVTELQMFAHLGPKPEGTRERLNRQNLVSPGTLGEALYDTLIYQTAARLQPLVELVTHSATVNHGGGLRKEHERVYANPCYYANLLFAEFAETTPVAIQLTTAQERAPIVLPDIKDKTTETSFGAVAALAARNAQGNLLISLVHRGTEGPIRIAIQLQGFASDGKAQWSTLSGPTPWSANTLEQPEAVQPVASQEEYHHGVFTLVVPPFSIVQARLSPAP